MNWRDELIAQVARRPCCGYAAEDAAASEPTAVAALALLAAGRSAAAAPALAWLAETQAEDGSLGVRRGEPTPRWPTALGVLAWQAAEQHGPATGPPRYTEQIRRAVAWMLAARGKTQPRTAEVAHDPTLAAWSWVADTHAWIEPTALHVLALKAAGHDRHPRVREAVRMLVDRQLPGGGCNYGNTVILGRQLRPHVQPTGLALWALAGEQAGRARSASSLRWLRTALSPRTTTLSLCWGLLGLAAWRQAPDAAERWLAAAHDRHRRPGCGAFPSALIALALSAVSDPRFAELGRPVEEVGYGVS